MFDGLSLRLEGWSLFQDLDSIPPGADFEAEIRSAIGSCDVLLLVIGDNWLDRQADGRRRIDDDEDIVRLEVRAAIDRGIAILPVLVEDAEMPSRRELPADIAPVARYNALTLTDERWPQDLSRLADVLRGIVAEAETAGGVDSPAQTTDKGPLELPARVTARWLEQKVPEMNQADLLELGRELRARRWTDGDIMDLAFAYAATGAAPRNRNAQGDVRSDLRATVPARVTIPWCERAVPEMGRHQLATLTDVLAERGWTAGEIEDYVLAFADPAIVEDPGF